MSKTWTTRATSLAMAGTALLVAVVGLLTWRRFIDAREAQFWVHHTYNVVSIVKDLALAVRDAESGQRGYLLTGQESYLRPYRDALDRVTLLEGELDHLTADNPAQQDRLRTVAPIIQRKLEELAQTIELRRSIGGEAAMPIVRTDLGQRLMVEIAQHLDAITTAEQRLRDERQAAAASAEFVTRWLALGGAAAAVLLLALAARILATAGERLIVSEAEQRVLAEQMRASFDSISQGIAVFGPDRRLARWNECFPVLLGLPGPMARQGTPYEALADQLAEPGRGPFLETEDQVRHGRGGRAPGEPVVYERTRAADGRSFELRRTPMPDGGFVLTVTDATERVLTEARSRDAQRMQVMGQLTGGIAHDFNNLLSVVMGNLELAKLKLEEGSSILPRIERAIWGAERGATLTQQLLAFARKQPLVPRPIDLSAMLPDITSLLRRTLGEHIAVRVVDAAGLWPALADAAQVESALLNLALNARDAMSGGGRLTIEVANKVLDEEYARRHTEVSPGDYVMLAVSDTGTGMTPEVQARVFEPFFTTKEVGKGTGLGLAMVFGFAKQSGGHVKIYSEPGEGTTVRLYLPRAIGVILPAPQRPGVPVELPRGSATVLVVEDEPAVREVTASMLRDLGYRVLEAVDGAEALRVFGENAAAVDLLLADVVLSGHMKGHEVARRLAEVRPALRVLFMSGYTENAIVHHGRLDDGAHLIGKPFQREQLARKVAEVLGNSAIDVSYKEGSNVVGFAGRDHGRAL